MDELSISLEEGRAILAREEGHFFDFKSADSAGKVIQKIAVAFANADGGEFAVGIEDAKTASGDARWTGFATMEDANHVLQSLAQDVRPAVPFSVQWLRCADLTGSGVVCLVTIQKSSSVHETADGTVYVRSGARNTRLDGPHRVNLALSKGAESYESQELATYDVDELVAEDELAFFLSGVSPKMEPRDFVSKQRLVNKTNGQATLAAAVLFAENPPALSPKRCAVKIARYETKVEKPERKHLAGVPTTIEAPARVVIDDTIQAVTSMIEAVSFLDATGKQKKLHYPPEALKEVIVNAVIHRDYNVSDDIVIRVFDNRIEVKSPGVLPGHMTLDNLLTERFSRNPTINRLINKYPDPPNKDIGDGLKTLVRSMAEAKLKAPRFEVDGNYFVVTIEHTPLARPHELVLKYLESHDEITNRVGRELSGINSENTMKEVFYDLRNKGLIEPVPGKAGNKSAWRRIAAQPDPVSVAATDGARKPETPTFDFTLPPGPFDVAEGASPVKRGGQRVQPRRLTRSKRAGRKR